MIRIENIHLAFNPGTAVEAPALRGLNLEVSRGEFVAVIGSNGAGKSTLLNVLAGEVGCDAGRVMINGNDVTGLSAAQRAGLVARVFQDPMAGTCENLSIEENLALAGSRGHRRGLRRAVAPGRRRAFQEQIAELHLGLERRLTDPMGLLSGGQRQAVSLLMATINPARVLLLDEHTAALDPRTANFVMSLTGRLVREFSLTTIMVTHSMRQALDHGTRTVMLHEGQVVLDIAGDERRGMNVEDLLHMFEQMRGDEVSDDGLILG